MVDPQFRLGAVVGYFTPSLDALHFSEMYQLVLTSSMVDIYKLPLLERFNFPEVITPRVTRIVLIFSSLGIYIYI